MTQTPVSQMNVSAEEYELLQELRRQSPASNRPQNPPTLGEKLADAVAATVGSWRFISIQSLFLVAWLILNVVISASEQWDPYPFILLNLVMSFQAAFTAPIIMMSQNRQSAIDRYSAQNDYDVNIKAELEVELLHDQLNKLRNEEISELKTILHGQQTLLEAQQQCLIQLGDLFLEREKPSDPA